MKMVPIKTNFAPESAINPQTYSLTFGLAYPLSRVSTNKCFFKKAMGQPLMSLKLKTSDDNNSSG